MATLRQAAAIKFFGIIKLSHFSKNKQMRSKSAFGSMRCLKVQRRSEG